MADLAPVVASWRAPNERDDAYVDAKMPTPTDAHAAAARVRVRYHEQRVDEETMHGWAEGAAKKVAAFSLVSQGKMLRAIGIDPFDGDAHLRAARDAWARDIVSNSDYGIKHLPEALIDRVAQTVVSGMEAGERHETIAERMREDFGWSDSKAKLRARDQVSKFNGKLAEVRQTRAGIDRYEWSTSLDERVRETHAENEGKIFEWANPPSETGNPGEDVLCRCVAIPVIDDGEEHEMSVRGEEP